jgi:hypothetical protein
MLALAFLLGQALGLPEVENPIPEKIGLGHILALTGAGAALGGISRFGAAPAKRERAVSWGSLIGFCLGAGSYLLLLLVQIGSSL